MDEFGINSGYVAELLDRYLHNPDSVDENWQTYFRSRLPGRESSAQPFGLASGQPAPATNGNGNGVNGHAVPSLGRARAEGPAPAALTVAEVQGRVSQLINAYRVRGHLFA